MDRRKNKTPCQLPEKGKNTAKYTCSHQQGKQGKNHKIRQNGIGGYFIKKPEHHWHGNHKYRCRRHHSLQHLSLKSIFLKIWTEFFHHWRKQDNSSYGRIRKNKSTLEQLQGLLKQRDNPAEGHRRKCIITPSSIPGKKSADHHEHSPFCRHRKASKLPV